MNEELIQKVIDKYNLSKEEVTVEYKRIEVETHKMFSADTEEVRAKRTAQNFTTFYKDIGRIPHTNYEGVVLYIEPKNFMNKKMIEKALRSYEGGPVSEIMWKDTLAEGEKQGFIKLIDGVPRVVDNRTYMGKTNIPNFGYGKLLNPEEYQRAVHGVVHQDGKMITFYLPLRGDYKDITVPLNTPVSFKAKMQRIMETGSIQLSAMKLTKFIPLPNAQIDIPQLVQQIFPLVDIKDLDVIAQEARDKKQFNKLVLIKGQVTDLNLLSEKPKMRLMQESLDLDDSADVSVKISEELINNIDFGEFSTVLVLGSPWVIIRTEDQSKLLGMTAFGIYPIVKTTPAKVEPVTTADLGGPDEFLGFNDVVE